MKNLEFMCKYVDQNRFFQDDKKKNNLESNPIEEALQIT